MKKLWLFVAAIAIISCKNETADYALVSGKVLNAGDTKEINIVSADRSVVKKVVLAEDGSFNDTIKTAGSYTIYQQRNATPLYLQAGNNITVNYDAKEYVKTLVITGAGAEISNYLVGKGTKERELMGKGTEVYLKEEADYKKVFYSIKTAQKNLLAEATGVSEDYKAKEGRNIHYSYLGKLEMYKVYHAHYAKKKGFEPSAEFLSELKDVTYHNEEDFEFSSAYQNLVTAHYNKVVSDKVKADKSDRSITALKVYGEVKEQAIKNKLIYNAARYNITYTDKIEEFYAAFKAAGSTNEKNNADVEKSYNILKNLVKGAPSPKFVDYENNAGGTTSLDDLKGKYTYIDIWATWCGPCIREIPSLKKVEKSYHGKNIQFLSISIDAKKDHQKWKDMIKDKKLGGIQLYADNLWDSKFVADYYVKGIPKFILLDPKGNIVTANAPRPSDTKLIDLFNELKI